MIVVLVIWDSSITVLPTETLNLKPGTVVHISMMPLTSKVMQFRGFEFGSKGSGFRVLSLGFRAFTM